MCTHRRPSGVWLVVVSQCLWALLAVPRVSWAQVPARNPKSQLLRLEVGDTVWVTEAPQIAAEQKTEEERRRSWDEFARIAKIGKEVAVTLMGSTTIEGQLLGIDEGSITVGQAGGPRAIASADVLRVRYAGIRRRHVLYGMLIGAAAGGVAVWAIDRQSSHPSSTAESFGMGAVFVGLPSGALGGAVLPIGPPLYEAALGAGRTRQQ